MAAIVVIQLARLQKQLEDRKIALDLDESAKAWLAEKGYDPVYGARPLKRVIQREVQDPLADRMLAGEIPDGSVVKITGGTDKLLFLPKVEGGKAKAKGRAA
jgi:ATP-dependent Clp protease ATP-binding subunit ClpB